MARTDGPFEHYGERFKGASANAQTIRTDAENPGLHAKDLNALAGELEGDAQQVAAQIEGDITADVQTNPRVASTTATTLAAKGTYAVAVINSYADMVEAFDTTVDSLNERFHTGFANKKADAAESVEHSNPGAPPRATAGTMRKAVIAELQPEYNAALLKLDGEAESVAANFNQGATDENVRELIRAGLIPLSAAALYPGLKLETADYVGALGQMTAQQQIDWINQNKDNLPAEAAAAIKPEVQEQYANQIAEDIKDPDDIDEETVKLLKFFQGQEAFAAQLYTTVSPAEMADAVKNMNDRAFPMDPNNGQYSTKVSDEDEARIDLYRDFLNASGVALATYSKADGAYAPPGGPAALADTWYKAITNEDNDPNDAAALTLLIKSGGHQAEYDTTFMSDLTGKVYEWERDQDGAVWAPRADAASPLFDPNQDYGITVDSSSTDSSIEWKWSGVEANDGLANLLGGMEKSPDAANEFFHGRYDGSEQTLQERMDYLVGGGDGRTWDGADGSDDGDGLGKALQAATVGGDYRTVDGTEVANALFGNIAEHGGEGDGTFDNRWHVGPNMTDSLGTIASGYSEDIYEMLRNSDPDNGALSLDISNKELVDVLGEIGGSDDKTGLETLTTSMLLQCRNENIEYLHDLQGPHNLSTMDASGYLGLQEVNGDVMGNLTHYGTELAADNDKTAEARAALVSKALTVAGGFIPGGGSVLGEGASELAKMTYDTVKSTALSEISEAVKDAGPSSAAEYRQDAEATLPRQMAYNSLSDLYRTDFLDKQEMPTGTYDGIDPILFQGDPPTLRPELFDADGNDLPADLPDREKIKQAWNDFTDSDAYYPVFENTYTRNFSDRMQNPTPLEGV